MSLDPVIVIGGLICFAVGFAAGYVVRHIAGIKQPD